MRFKDWFLQETGTSTADIAGFSRISIPLVRRWWEGKPSKRKYRQPQVKEAAFAGLQQAAPTAANYAKTLGGAALRVGASAIPFAGAVADVGQAAYRIWQMRQEGKDVTRLIAQMMNAKDKAPGIPANLFDLEDNLASTISNNAKLEVARQIVARLDGWIQQIKSGRMAPETANHVAIQYLQQKLDSVRTSLTNQ